MTCQVRKYELVITDEQLITMPKGSSFLHIGEQNGGLYAWLLTNPDAPDVLRRVFVHGTGHLITHHYDYVATVVMSERGHNLVWHVFDGEEVRS